MRRSFLRLVVTSVLAFWGLTFVILASYVSTRTWHGERARTDGVYLVYDELQALTPPERDARLEVLQPHFEVHFEVLGTAEAAQRVDQDIAPGEEVPLDVSWREEWLFLAFHDGDQVLAAGPVNPVVPADALPVGALLAIFGIPLIAVLYAWRIERQVSKVESATQAIATGELDARVDNPEGPSAELAASFNAMAERVQQLIRDRDELVQAVSHELGSPLSRLRFQLALLEDSPVPDDRDARLQAMTRELDALERLVAELLSYVQADASRLEPQDFDPEPGLADLIELARLDAPAETDVDIALVVEGPLRLRADRRHFERATENLLRNAVQHAESKVLLTVSDGDDGVTVAVHDDGPGIPDAEREHVLAPFVRLDADRSRHTGGVGLGLAIVARVVEHHGGELIIGDSTPLGGACITTVWPTAGNASTRSSPTE